jgi:hypothetical protein
VIVNTMFEVARACHDALDLLTPPEESAAVAALIAAFLGWWRENHQSHLQQRR